MVSSKKVSRRKRIREDGEDPGTLSRRVSDSKKKKARDSADTRTSLSNGIRTGVEGAVQNVELSVTLANNSHHGKSERFDTQHISQLTKREKKRRKKSNGVQEGTPNVPRSNYEFSSEFSNMHVDQAGFNGQLDDNGFVNELDEYSELDEYKKIHKSRNSDVSFLYPRSKFELVRLLQNTKIPRPRKIEVICKFIKDWEELMCSTGSRDDQSCLRIQVKMSDMGMPQFLSFLSEWIQHAILWSSKYHELIVGEECSNPPFEDPRYWGILSWCLSSKDLPQSASAPSRLFSCLIQFVDKWDFNYGHEGNRLTQDDVNSMQVLLAGTHRSFRPNLDQWVSLAVIALKQFLRWDPDEDSVLQFRFFVHILEGFSGFIALYPNRKKTFLCIVDNLLDVLLRAHAYLILPGHRGYLIGPRVVDFGVKELESFSDGDVKELQSYVREVKEWQKRLLKATEEIVEKGLFHTTHIGSFHEVCLFLSSRVDGNSDERNTKVDKKKGGRLKKVVEERDFASYQKLLFRKLDQLRQRSPGHTESLEGMTQIGWIFETYSRTLTAYQAADALDIFGLNAKGKLQVPPRKANVEKTVHGMEKEGGKVVDVSSAGLQPVDIKDHNREARFTVFAELTGPIVTDLQACWSAAKGNNENHLLHRAEFLLVALNGLLKVAAIERTYVPTEDSAKQTHFTFLSKCFGVVIDFGRLLPGLLKDSDVAISHNVDSKPQPRLLQEKVDKRIARYLIGRLLREIILATGHLLEIEYRVADNLLDDVWAILLHGAVLQELCKKEGKAEIASHEAVGVACQIISTYSDLRQVDRALLTLCGTLKRFFHRPLTAASQCPSWSFSPTLESSGFLVCSKTFLSAVASAVHTLPEGQVAEFIRLLTADSLDSLTALEEIIGSRRGGFELKADQFSNNLLSQVGLVELYNCVLQNVSVTPTNSLLCCKVVSSFMKEVVTPNMGELIDSCLISDKCDKVCAGSLDTGERRELGKEGIEGSMMTWNVIFKLRLFLACRGLHIQCLHLMPPGVVKKKCKAFGGYVIDYHKLDVPSVLSRLSAGIFLKAVGRDSVKVSDFLTGIKMKINKNELLDYPALHHTLDCIAMESLVDLARHAEAVSFLVARYNDVSHVPGGETVSSQLLRQGSKSQSPTVAEAVDVEHLKKLQKLLRSLKQESRMLAKTLLQELPSLTDACQLVNVHSASTELSSEILSGENTKLGYQNKSELMDCPWTQKRSAEVHGKQLVQDHPNVALTVECLTVRRWRLYCQTFDVWAKFAADKDLKKFLTYLFECSIPGRTTQVSSYQKDGEMPGPGVTVMQHVVNDLLSNAFFFEQESIRRLFGTCFLEAFRSLVCSAFGNWPFEWFTSDTLLESESLFRWASEFSDLVKAQIGEIEEEEDPTVFQAKKSLGKMRMKWKIEAFELDLKALHKCVALVDHLSALPPGYMISSEATRCAFAVQCFERLLVQSILHKRLTAIDTQHGGNKSSNVDSLDILVVLEALCSCRSALLALTSTGVECWNHSECSVLTVLCGSFELVQWPAQSLDAAATCLVDIVEHSSLSDKEKLNKLYFGQNLLHIALKRTSSLLTYIYNETLQLERSTVYGNPSELASVSSVGNKDALKLAADGSEGVNVKIRSSLDELLRLQGVKIEELVQRIKVQQISSSDGPELMEGQRGRDFKSWFCGLVLAASLCSYFWSLASTFEKHARDALSLEKKLMLPLESGGKIDTLGHILMKTLVRALVPDGSHAMLLVGEREIDRNLQWTSLEAIEGKDSALRPEALRGRDLKKKDDDSEESDEDDFQITSDHIGRTEQDRQRESKEEEDDDNDDAQRDETHDDEIVFWEGDQEKVAEGIDLDAADYSNKSSTQRVALETLFEGSGAGRSDLVGELYLAAAGFVKLEALTLLHRKEVNKFSGGLPAGVSVLLGAGYWILSKAAKHMRSGQCTNFGWLVGVVKYMESVGSLLPHTKSPLTASAFSKLFNMHLYLLGSLSPAEIPHHNRHSSQPFDAINRLDLCFPTEFPAGGMTKDEVKGSSDSTLREAVRRSLGLLMKAGSRHHSVLALQAITRALVGASEDSYSTSGLELSGHDSGKVGRGVAAGVQSLSIALEAVSGTKRLRLLANHFNEFSGAIFNLIECFAGPKLFHKHEMAHHDKPLTEVQTGMVLAAPVILRCIEIVTNVASREAIYPLKACHVALALHCPAIIFSPLYHSGFSKHRVIRSSLAYDYSGAKHEKQVVSTILSIGSDVGVELYVACCRLLCSLIRHRRRESGHCIALLGDSTRVLLHCLESTYWPLSDDFSKAWSTKMATFCATWLRRIYEEMSEHKETLGKYCCHILSHYLSVLSGHGPLAVGLTREVEAALRPGAYALVDACSANDLQQLHASLGEGPQRSALLALRREYTHQFKYTGKV